MPTSNQGLYEAFTKIDIRTNNGALYLTLNNPPVNVLDGILMKELFQFCNTVENDSAISVIVFQSANEEFFLAHGDMNFVAKPETFAVFDEFIEGNGTNAMQQLHLRIHNLPQVTIGKLRGYIRGGGIELVQSLDMRFALEDQTWLGQPESRAGIIPGGGGTQFLTQLVGRARAMEIILGGALFDTRTAAAYGLINRAFPKEQLDEYVDQLAARIGGHLPNVAAFCKKAISAARPQNGNFQLENELMGIAFTAPEAVQMTLKALENGAQTVEGERNLEAIFDAM